MINFPVQYCPFNDPNFYEYPSPPINRDHLKKLIRAELTPTWFDKKSANPDMSWVTPAVIEILFTELITHTRGNQSKAARMLGINRGNFSKKLNQLTAREFGLHESL